MKKTIFFLSLLFTSVCSSAGLAHLFSLPNKINMSERDYFIAQQVYNGWSLFAIVIVAALISVAVQTFFSRKDARIFPFALSALVCLILSQILFWTFTFPANQKTQNWTFKPDNWAQLRENWEYSHAVASLFTLGAFMLIIISVLRMTTIKFESAGEK